MIKDVTGNQTCEHRTLTEEYRTEYIGEAPEEAKTSSSVCVGGNQVQGNPGDLPEEAIPDQESHIPAKQDELQDRNAYENIPEARWRQIPPATWHCIPSGRFNSEAIVPEPESKTVNGGK